MKEKNLVKVVASIVQDVGGRTVSSTARGIVPLRRDVAGFIADFLEERQVTTYSLHQRSEDTWATSPITMSDDPQVVMVYHFVLFPASEIGFNAKDLTAEELERDMKQMTKHING